MRPVASDPSRLASESASQRRRRRLNSFRPPFRVEVARLTANWPELEDLADSFPAMLFALATGYGRPTGREQALEHLVAGRPLREVAAALGLPVGLRRIPAEALRQPLAPLPTDAEFSEAVLNRIPVLADECAVWLDRLCITLRIAGRDVAAWSAREPRFLPPAMSEEDFNWMLAWAWASRTPRSPGHALLRTAWSPALGWKRAQDEIAIWRKRIELIGALAEGPRDPWFENGRALGLDIVHLDSPSAFIAESAAMENCLDQYATHLAYGRVRVFSIRRDGRPIADLELTLRADETTMPTIAQVRGPRNRRAPPQVWQAIHAWLGAQCFRALAATPTSPVASREAIRAFWLPYLEALETAGLAERLGGNLPGREQRRYRGRAQAGTLTAAIREAIAASIQRRAAS